MADMPDVLLEQIKEIEDIFTVNQATLKKIVAHFVKELEKGMQIPIFLTHPYARADGDDGQVFLSRVATL